MAADTQQKSAELAARLDRLPFSKWHRNLFVLCFLGVMFDACDFALFGMALPPVAREFGLNPAQAGLLATVGLVGAFLGALFWGTISDYIGRRTAFASTIGIFSLFTGLVGASWNVLSLAVFRFLSNFGLGGEVPVALTLTAEFSPARIRGRMAGSMMAAFPVGLALAAIVSLVIIRPMDGARFLSLAWSRRCCCSSCASLCRNRSAISSPEVGSRKPSRPWPRSRRRPPKASRCRRCPPIMHRPTLPTPA